MDVAALISGGKDSALALHHALERNFHVKWLLTLIPLRDDSWMFHYPNAHITNLFAEASEIPLITRVTSGEKGKELEDLESVIEDLEIEGLIYGAVESKYQRRNVEAICEKLDILPIAPLWGKDPLEILHSLTKLGFEVVIVGVYAYGFDETWLGRKLNLETINALIEQKERHRISLVGEGGEYETFVLDAPYFKKRIEILSAEKVWNSDSGYLKIIQAELKDKGDSKQ